MSFDGQTTSAIAWDASASTVQPALESLSNIDAGEVAIVKTKVMMDTQEWRITFAASLSGTNAAQTTVGVPRLAFQSETTAEIDFDGTSSEVNPYTYVVITTESRQLSDGEEGPFHALFPGDGDVVVTKDDEQISGPPPDKRRVTSKVPPGRP